MVEEDAQHYADSIRELINKENDLLNNRMTWMILLHGLLFAGYYQVYNDNFLVSLVIPIVGVLISYVMIYSFRMNEKAIAFILEKWNTFIINSEYAYDDFAPVWAGAGWDLSVKGKYEKFLRLFQEHKALPKIFLFAWLANIVLAVLMELKVILR